MLQNGRVTAFTVSGLLGGASIFILFFFWGGGGGGGGLGTGQ